MDPYPDPTQDLTPFFSKFKDAQIFFFFIFFLPAGTLSSVLAVLWIRIRIILKGGDPDPDPHQSDNLDQFAYSKPKCIWNMGLFEHFSYVLCLSVEARIRIRIKVMRIRNTNQRQTECTFFILGVKDDTNRCLLDTGRFQ